jgi:hypothetical protein
MNTIELKDYLKNNKDDAFQLLMDIDPNLHKELDKALKKIRNIVLKVREKYPEANIYLDEDNLHLMLGDSHNVNSSHKSNQELVAYSDSNLIGIINAGGW